MFQQTFSNALSHESSLANQPHHIKIPLRLHQLSVIHKMKEKEIGFRAGYKLPSGDTLFSSYAILGDRVGVGKTLMALSHISQMALEPLRPPNPMSNLHPTSTSILFSLKEQEPTILFDSLIIVPHTIYRQWQDSITDFTSLKAHFLKSQRDISDTIITSLGEAHLTLISNTLLPSLMSTLNVRAPGARWRRIFYDEADTIKIIGNSIVPVANMTWLITASYINLLFANKHYHSHILRQLPEEFTQSLHQDLRESIHNQEESHPNVTFFKTQSFTFFHQYLKLEHPLRGHTVIRNSEEFLNTSIQLPPLRRQIVRCHTPMNYKLIKNIIPTETQTMLNAGDIKGALQSLGIPAHSQTTIIAAATAYQQKELDRLQRLLDFKKNETYATQSAKDHAIRTLEEKIKAVAQRTASINKRIEEASRDSCAICFDPLSQPCMTPCCSKLFCGECILGWISKGSQGHTCPLCRTPFIPSALIQISSEATGIYEFANELPKKMDALLDIIKTSGRFLIFSRYENSLEEIRNTIMKNTDKKPTLLQGNKDVIANILSDFDSKNINILLLNSRTAAAGMNISTATHVILMHKMADDEEKQILGRAYRMGRTEPLDVIQLLNDNEV